MGSQREEDSSVPIQAVGKPYAVVELKVGKSRTFTSPALTCWLRGINCEVVSGKEEYTAAKCFWPRNESRLSEILVNKRKPKDDWNSYRNVRIFTFCRTLASANQLADKAAFTSDVTEDECSPPAKRRRQQTTFYSQDPSSDDESPLINLRINGADSISSSSQNGSRSPPASRSRSPSASRSRSPSASRSRSPSASRSGSFSASRSRTPSASRSQSRSGSPPLQVQQRDSYQDSTKSQNPDEAISRQSSLQSTNSGGVSARFLTHFIQLKKDLEEVKKMVIKMYILFIGPEEGFCSSEVNLPSLPMNNLEDFNKFCDFCNSEDKKLGMVKYLSEYGSNELRESVFSILKKMMANELAVTFNLTGVNRRGVDPKTKFDGTCPFLVLKAAVKQQARKLASQGADGRHQYNTSEFRGAVSDWLKDAKKRIQNGQKRAEKRLANPESDVD